MLAIRLMNLSLELETSTLWEMPHKKNPLTNCNAKYGVGLATSNLFGNCRKCFIYFLHFAQEQLFNGKLVCLRSVSPSVALGGKMRGRQLLEDHIARAQRITPSSIDVRQRVRSVKRIGRRVLLVRPAMVLPPSLRAAFPVDDAKTSERDVVNGGGDG